MKTEKFPELKNISFYVECDQVWIKQDPPQSISNTEMSEHQEERDDQINFREKTWVIYKGSGVSGYYNHLEAIRQWSVTSKWRISISNIEFYI